MTSPRRTLGRRLAALVVVAVVAACSSGSDSTSTGADEARVRHARLRADDLGPDWTLVADEAPGQGASVDTGLERCAGAGLAAAEDTLAESHRRTFERSAGPADQQQLVNSSALLTSVDDTDRLFDAVATDRFADCLTRMFERGVAGGSGDGVRFDTADPEVRADDVAGADRSVRVSSAVTLEVDATRVDGRLDMVLVSAGRAVTVLFGFALGPPIGADQLDRLAHLLLDRLK